MDTKRSDMNADSTLNPAVVLRNECKAKPFAQTLVGGSSAVTHLGSFSGYQLVEKKKKVI